MSKVIDKRSLAIKIMISLFVLAIGISLVLGIRNCQKKNAQADNTGTITITIENLAGDTVTRKIEFDKEYSMMDILTMTYGYNLKTDTTSLGIRLLGISDKDEYGNEVTLDTDFKTSYIAIYVDGKYSSKGISLIEPVDGMVLLLKETKI